MTPLLQSVLGLFIALVVGAFALPIMKHVVIGWVRLYTTFVPKELREERRVEVLSDIHEQISSALVNRYRPVEVAGHMFVRWLTGLPDEFAWFSPFVPSLLASKAARLSQSVSSFRTPKILIPSLATFGVMNWAYLSSSGARTFTTWLGLNVMTGAMIVLISKQQHAWARRVLYTFMGGGGVMVLGYMAWWMGPSKLYEMIQLPMFRGFLIAMVVIGLGMLVADKSIRTRLFQGRWRYVIICWLAIIAVSLVASMALAGSVTPMLSALAVAAGLIASMFIFCGIIGLVTAAFWHGCLRGTAAGLRAVAAGLRRLN